MTSPEQAYEKHFSEDLSSMSSEEKTEAYRKAYNDTNGG